MDTESPSVSRIATWCLVLGGILAALGTLAVMTPWVAAKVIAVFCGISLLVAGVSQVAMAVGTYTWRGFWVTLVCGGLSTMAGIGMLVLPEAGVEALVLFLGFLLAFEAVAKLAAAFTIREGFPWNYYRDFKRYSLNEQPTRSRHAAWGLHWYQFSLKRCGIYCSWPSSTKD